MEDCQYDFVATRRLRRRMRGLAAKTYTCIDANHEIRINAFLAKPATVMPKSTSVRSKTDLTLPKSPEKWSR
jgi:hypothetical protein